MSASETASNTEKETPITYGELLVKLQGLTPAQLAMPVQVASEMGGGTATDLFIAEEDLVDPSGEGMEPVSVYLEQWKEEGETEETIKELIEEHFVCHKDTPFILFGYEP